MWDDIVGVLDSDVLRLRQPDPGWVTLHREALHSRHGVLVVGPADVGDREFNVRDGLSKRAGPRAEYCAIGDPGALLLALGRYCKVGRAVSVAPGIYECLNRLGDLALVRP